jgi:hypothetical protein
MPNSDRRNSSQQSQEMDEYPYKEQEYTLPRNGLISSLIIGLIGGFIALAIPIAIVLINASLFSAAASAASKDETGLSYQLAISLLTWQCSGVFVDLLIAFGIGMIVGKVAVKRKLGFLAGAITGGIVYLGIFFAQYIPGYPGVITTTGTSGTWLPGFLTAIGLCLIWALVGGLMSLWGTTIATRRHPYYLLRQQESQPKE